MIRPVRLIAGAVLGTAMGAALAHERRMRRHAERFSAAALESLLRAIDANDAQTGAHVRRVATYALTLADACGVDPRMRRTIELGALFHDIGKIDEALFDLVHEPRSLTAAERRSIATHPARGADVLAPVANFYPHLTDAVLAHHERWDGSGYPRGLRKHSIPFAARVVALADTFDVITFGRRYRDGRAGTVACGIIASARGTQFDPDLTDLMLFPPVLASIMRSHRAFVRSGSRIPQRHMSVVEERSPNVRIRWRTRSSAPANIRVKLRESR
ncbi:MAG: HD domain-containing phosphohydrolase [Gemmatimonadaceae bacterium]